MDCDDGRDQASVVALQKWNDALVLLLLNHPLALSHLEWIMAALRHLTSEQKATLHKSTVKSSKLAVLVPFLPVDGRVNILAFLHTITDKKTIPGANNPNQ